MTTNRNKIWLARGLAITADIVQVALLPATAPGVFSPVEVGIDVVMAVVLTLLTGWHLAYVPSFLIKFVPVADLAPTWTIAVLIATRGGSKQVESRQVPARTVS